MSTIAKEKYRDEGHRQPPMCGGIVFSKFRPKVQDKKKRHHNQEDNLFKAFDQRPVMTDSRSATSSNASSDGSPASPETALLADKSRSKRGSTRKLIPLKDFVHATTLDLSSRQNQEILRAEFLMEEKAGKESIHRRESPAVEFDPNDVHQLRGKHIRSKADNGSSTQPELDLFMNSAFPYSSKPPKSPRSLNKEMISSLLLDQDDPMAQIPLPSPRALGSPTWNTNVASQQKEAFDIISSQNIYYRNKLGNAQKSFRKLVKDQSNQADVIDKLKMEKETFQAETLLLREEMKAIRQQLDMFQQLLKQQQGSPAMTNVDVRAQLEEPNISPGTDEMPKEAVVTAVGTVGSTKDEFPGDFPFVHPMSSNVDESEDKSVATDPAKNYWKREWELSMKEMRQEDHVSTDKEAAYADDENSDPFCGISRHSPVNVTDAPARGVDPPEVKKTSLRARKSIPQKPSTPLHTKRPEPNASEIPNKTTNDDNDYVDDVKYVQQLMEKYKHQFILQEPSLSHDEPDLHRSVKGLDEQEKIFEIENMADVDREYSQRQQEMARLRAAFERGELDDSLHDSRGDFVHSQPGENKQSQNTNMTSIQSSKHGSHPLSDHKFLDHGRPTSSDDFSAYPLPLFLRAMRLQEPTLPDPSEHGSATFESRQDESGRSERSGMEDSRDVSHHSHDTEYADQIEHSTSHHHALLWSHSRGREVIPTEEQRDPPPSRELSHLKKSTQGERHVSLVDVMESEESSSEQTLAEVRDPGRNGRKGATYKIKMSSGSSQRQQNLSTSSGNDEATIPTNQEPRGKAMPIHDRKSLARRLI